MNTKNMFDFKNWIFDMDGTLTVACHDFDHIRQQLGLSPGLPILEELNKYPVDQAQKKHQRLFELEMELAYQATAQPGIEKLLIALKQKGSNLGIVTRNSLEIAHATLQACGLSDYFEKADILGRECSLPKPDPAGPLALIEQWQCLASESVMVGDYLFDLQSGHRAGLSTIHFDQNGSQHWPDVTDYRINNYIDMVQHVTSLT